MFFFPSLPFNLLSERIIRGWLSRYHLICEPGTLKTTQSPFSCEPGTLRTTQSPFSSSPAGQTVEAPGQFSVSCYEENIIQYVFFLLFFFGILSHSVNILLQRRIEYSSNSLPPLPDFHRWTRMLLVGVGK